MSGIETKKKIVEAMYKLIAENGYAKASIGQIAERVSINKASVYYYFKSKDDILFEMLDSFFDEEIVGYTFYETSNYEEYKNHFKKIGDELIDNYQNDIEFRKFYAEISIVGERNETVKAKLLKMEIALKSFIEKFFKHGLNIKVLNADFDVELSTNMTLLIFAGMDNAVTYDHDINLKKTWAAFVNKII